MLLLAACATPPSSDPRAVRRLDPTELASTEAVRPGRPLGLDEIVRRSREGVPTAALLDVLRSTGTHHALSPSEVLRLREQGVAPEDIQWVMPRDVWLQDRANIQSGDEFFMNTWGNMTRQLEAVVAAAAELVTVVVGATVVVVVGAVDDVAAANVAATTYDHGGFTAFNVCSGHPIAIREVAEQLCVARNAPPPKVTGQYRSGDVRHIVADPVCATQELGFTAAIHPRDGLRDFAFAPLRD